MNGRPKHQTRTDKAGVTLGKSFIFAALMLCGCAHESEHKVSSAPSFSSAMEAASNVKPLSVGETIKITIIYESEKSAHRFTIDPRGNVTIPGFGVIHVEGMTPDAAGKKLEADYLALAMHRHVLFEVSRF